MADGRYDLGDHYFAAEFQIQWGEDMAPVKLSSSRPFKVGVHEGQLNEKGNAYEQAAVRWSAHGWDFSVKLPPGKKLPQKRAVALVTQAAEAASAWADQFLPGGQPLDATKLAEHVQLLDLAAHQHEKDAQLTARNAFVSILQDVPSLGGLVADVQLDPHKPFILVVTVSDAWFSQPKPLRQELAQQLWQLWAAKNSPNVKDPDGSKLKLVSASGQRLGGSGIAGSMVSLDD
ncbi:hypothetical protein NR798_11465 [Archangium gephyra]|uniref:hypothetical protein n=1 Tax=Archangium gephyra TaxID=48 RepID=UPI0035D4C7EB